MPNGSTITMTKTASYLWLAGSVIVGVLIGYYGVDIISFTLNPARRVHFYVADGKIDPDSVRINRWFLAEDYTGKDLPAGAREVFGFPYEKKVDPYRCFFYVGGVAMYKDYPQPPAPPPPPCPK